MASTLSYIAAAIAVLVIVAAYRHNTWMKKNCICKEDRPLAVAASAEPAAVAAQAAAAAAAPAAPPSELPSTSGGFVSNWMPRWITNA